jgi:hypothetical protein
MLTLLAIQGVNMTKVCGICGRPYFKKEAYLPDIHSTDDDLDEDHGDKSFAQNLFAACEACIYCGGKFIENFTEDNIRL